MTLSEWASRTAAAVRSDGVVGLKESGYQLYVGAWRRFGQFYNYGINIFDYDWDLLVVLDACRADLMNEVADQYDFVESGASRASIGSATEEWMAKTFTSEHRSKMRETAYVTGNPHSSEGLRELDFDLLDEVWEYAWDDDQRTTLARAVTDRAIATHRNRNPDRLLVHYMQPHHPFVPTPELNENVGYYDEADWNHVWEMLREGGASYERVWDGYRRNLEYVLDDVRLLLENVDAETAVITADHGNALGEFGIYGHPMYVPLPALKRVPWSVTSAGDSGAYDPDTKRPTDAQAVERDVNDRLRDLGYKG